MQTSAQGLLSKTRGREGQNDQEGQYPAVSGVFSFIKTWFQPDSTGEYDDKAANKQQSTVQAHGSRGRQSAETKASSSQSAMQMQQKHARALAGMCPQAALEQFGNQLTEFEKIELGNYARIHTIGHIRRQNQYSIADKDGFYMAKRGEQLGYRYLIQEVIDKGSFGQVVLCIDMADPQQKKLVAAKIGKNKKFDVDNAQLEIKFLKKLNNPDKDSKVDLEGQDRIVAYLDSFNFRQHVVIIFEYLNVNVYQYIANRKQRNRRPYFDQIILKRVCYQMMQGLKYMSNQSIIHCDMKPENIIFTDDRCRNIKIIDFGASCEDCTTGFSYV